MRLPPRWVVAVSCAVAAAILGDSLLYAVLPAIYPELGLQAAMVGVLLSANRFVRLLSNPVAGWVVARAGVRAPFLIAVFVAALTTVVYALGLGFIVLLLGRIAWGICWSFLRLGGYLAALDSSNDGSRGYYLGFFNVVTRFGSFVAVVLGGLMTDVIGFETTVYIFAALTVLGGLAVFRERPPAVDEQRRREGAVSTRMFGDPALLFGPLSIVFVMAFVQAMTISGLITATLGAWIRQEAGDSIDLLLVSVGVATLTGFLLGTRFLSDFLWGPLSGHLSDRHGRRNLLIAAGLIEALSLVALVFAPNVWLLILATVILFLAATATTVSLEAITGDFAPPEQRSQTMSLYATCADLGSATGPVVGWVGFALGTMYLGSAGLLVLAGTMYLLLTGHRGAVNGTR
ncbi:MAG: MFS transporter [Chloroflexota bacterium]